MTELPKEALGLTSTDLLVAGVIIVAGGTGHSNATLHAIAARLLAAAHQLAPPTEGENP